MVPSRGKNKVEIGLCAMLIALASAEGLQVELLQSFLPDPCPSQGRSPWSQHHTALGVAGWAVGQLPVPQSELVLFRSDCKHQGTCPAPRCLPSIQVRAARHKRVLQLQGRPSGPLRNVERVFPPLRANVFC